MRTTRCGVATRCEKQSATSAIDFAERLARDQLAAQLAGDRDRDVDGFRLHPRLDAGEARGDALIAIAISSSASAARRSLSTWPRAAPPRAVAIGSCFRRRDPLGDLGGGRSPLARAIRRREVVIEEEFCGRGHQYTSSSSARCLGHHDLALGGEVLGEVDQRICASSTSRRRTGPIASMSSRRILPARSLMLRGRSFAQLPRWRP